MLLADLPRPSDRKAVPLFHVHLDTGVVEPDTGVVTILSVGASTNTKYREFPASVRAFLDGLTLATEIDSLEAGPFFQFAQQSGDPLKMLQTAIELGLDISPTVTVDKGSKVLRDRISDKTILKRWEKTPPTLSEALDELRKNNFFTAAKEIATHAKETRLADDVFWQVADLSLDQRKRVLEGLSSAVADNTDGLVVLHYAGRALHEHPVATAWHKATTTKKPGKASGKATLSCVICGEVKPFPESSQARIKNAVAGAGVDGSMLDAVSWGKAGNRICQDCWAGPIKESLVRLEGSLIRLRGTDVFLSVWDQAGGVEEVEDLLKASCDAGDLDAVKEAINRALKRQPGQSRDTFNLDNDLRIQVWGKSNSTLNIYDYVVTSKSLFLDKVVEFGNRFPTLTLRSMVNATSPCRFKPDTSTWEIEPTLADWQRWLKRLLRGTPLTVAEVQHILQQRMSIFLRGIEEPSGWLLRTQEHLMADHVKEGDFAVDTSAPAFLIGKALSIGSSIARSAGKDKTDKQRRYDGFRSTYTQALMANPLRGFNQMRSNIGLWSAKAYPADKVALTQVLAELSVFPTKFTHKDQCLFWLGLAAGDKETASRIEALSKSGEPSTDSPEPGKVSEAGAMTTSDENNPFAG